MLPLSRSCPSCSLPQKRSIPISAKSSLNTVCAAWQGRHANQPDQLPGLHFEELRTAVIAAVVCCAFVSNVREARADAWMPRRHHRHIGERFTDTWADSIVEVTRATPIAAHFQCRVVPMAADRAAGLLISTIPTTSAVLY